MSAADLFNSAADVEFRLLNTHIVVGKKPYKVVEVHRESFWAKDPQETLLTLSDGGGGLATVPLKRLPLRSMFDCPTGYFNGTWVSRGPCRSRHQGLVPNSFWCVVNDELRPGIDLEGLSVYNLLSHLLSQPRRRSPASRKKSGIMTRDVLIDRRDNVVIQGRNFGTYRKEGVVPNYSPSEIDLELLENARIPCLM